MAAGNCCDFVVGLHPNIRRYPLGGFTVGRVKVCIDDCRDCMSNDSFFLKESSR